MITDESCILFSYSTLFLIPAKARIQIVFEMLLSRFPFPPALPQAGGHGRMDTKGGGIEDSVFCLRNLS
jgi:hypothetical protein